MAKTESQISQLTALGIEPDTIRKRVEGWWFYPLWLDPQRNKELRSEKIFLGVTWAEALAKLTRREMDERWLEGFLYPPAPF